MATDQYETSVNVNGAFVAVCFWYAVGALLCHSVIIFIVPKLTVKVFDTPWYKHSNSLRFAMTVWTANWIISFVEVFGMSNYLINFTNYSIICNISIKCQSTMIGLTIATTFLCFISILENCFQSTAIKYSSKTILWLKMSICIPLIIAAILFNIVAVKGKVYAVKDDQNLIFCDTDQSGASTFSIFLAIFAIWYVLTEVVALSMFLFKMRKVMSRISHV